jgi:hypothetical protein
MNIKVNENTSIKKSMKCLKWIMINERNNIFKCIILKEFHVKYVKRNNKTCLIFNQDEMN